MSTLLPKDANGQTIPAIKMKDGGAHSISTSATSARNSTAFDANTVVISIYCTQDVYLKFGASDVVATASDHFFPAGTYYDVAIADAGGQKYTHLAALRVSADGALYISEKE